MDLPVRRVVIDAAIPTKNVSIVDVAKSLYETRGVKAVRVIVDDVDVDVLGLIVVVEGEGVDVKEIQDAIEKVGGVVHSLDEVVVGEYIPEVHAQEGA
ncbi:DUF211 domain-containing protein [Thermoproteus tenax]|uniref:Uncharacterized protein n=1 Tax=Thermoproteus tenax (strain ATCC 35583 / DSM 2078 / JCM 9277 / NBRC 100435 / Kra 1) TaxID=768679 RepID=G4RLN3_THETK|nr:DUF211 domain-containing protein [Thermoproteus tenax]CCC82478.1 conserved hypothetical protein [Thermoproteus tenax Kra 1]